MHGLSTLNRLLGKKNKEASRSTTNLSVSTSNLDTSSQHNKISPIISNAPFEQTFRVTVYLPKNQLYVERIGAKTKLGTLMERISENKHLTVDKYELRHPGDMSQVFDNDKTIGEVGLNELKLVLKTESRFNSDFHRFHTDDMMKYKSSVPDSVSSSEISRNYGKSVLQKPSPYSSTTSLNSLDSTGMNLTAKNQPPVAPTRKKRAAPRPPSQNSIPEQEIFGTTLNVFKEPHSILPKKNFHVSSPQLYNNNNSHAKLDTKSSDKNNNSIESGNRLNAITRPTSLYLNNTTEINQNGSAMRQRSPSESSEVQQIFRDRQNSSSLEKKKKPAPVPPKRSHKPTPSPRTVQEENKPSTITEIKEIDEHENPSRFDEKHLEHVNNGNVSKTMLNNSPDSIPSVESSDGPVSIQIVSTDSSLEHVKDDSMAVHPKLPAVSKVHIKPEEERRSSSEDEMTVNIYNVTKSVTTLEKQGHVMVSTSSTVPASREASPSKVDVKTSTTTTTISSTSANSQQITSSTIRSTQIVEEKKSIPVVEKRSIEVEKTPVVIEKKPVVVAKTPNPVEVKKTVYIEQPVSPIQEVKTTVQDKKPASPIVEVKQASPIVTQKQASPINTHKAIADVQLASPSRESKPASPVDEMKNPVVRNVPIETEDRPMSPLWTYTLPAPPVFADSSVHDMVSPTDRQKSGDKFFSDFASTDCNETVLSDSNTTVLSVETQIHPIIVDRKPSVESFNAQTKEFTRHVADDQSDKSTEIITSDLEDGYLGNGKVGKVETPLLVEEANRMDKEIVFEDFRRSRLLIARSDSFHSIGQARHTDSPKRSPFSPPQRSTSFLSLVQAQKAEALSRQSSNGSAPYSRQKSTSEISIHEAPSLQSIEVLKNILNSSRKNSLQDASPKEEKVLSFVSREPSVSPPRVEEVVVKKPEPVVEKKPAETTWRYTGPPKINLSTWNERPKVEVAIAADSDYKFGKVTTTSPRDLKAEVEPDFLREFKNRKDTTSKRHTIHISNDRSGTPENDTNTKPKVLGVEYKKDVSPVVLRDTSAEIVTKPAARTIINIKPRPMSMDITNAYSQIITSTAPSAVSYNRLNSNAKKFTPVVHGFKLNNIKESDQVDSVVAPVVHREPEVVVRKPSVPPSVPAKPGFLRSTSNGDINRRKTFSTVEMKPAAEPSHLDLPFSQTGLRRTGLKEKILESDKDPKSMFGKVSDSQDEGFDRQPEVFTEKVTIRSMSHQVPPKPPTAPPPMSFRKSAPVDHDSRNQLLDAIKTFKRDSLRNK